MEKNKINILTSDQKKKLPDPLGVLVDAFTGKAENMAKELKCTVPQVLRVQIKAAKAVLQYDVGEQLRGKAKAAIASCEAALGKNMASPSRQRKS